MRLRRYDNLRNFIVAAGHSSLASAADELCLTKGALSHQIRLLEADLGFALFERHSRGISLTKNGATFLTTARHAFNQIEQRAAELTGTHDRTLTIGVTTYFASRWLSSRLMDFMGSHPDVRLRIQPMIDLLDFRGEGVDLAIRWGDGNWTDCIVDKLFACAAWPTGNSKAFRQVRNDGLEAAFARFTLLRDHDSSVAWPEWYQRAGLAPRRLEDALIIPDPNVRVQAVLDGQGVALNDDLVAEEIRSGKLFRLSRVELDNYGYFLAYEPAAARNQDVAVFIDWIKNVR